MRTTVFAGLIMIVVLFFKINGFAQDTTSGSDTYGLDEIVVTSQKQEEKIQEVPISISVMNDIELEDRKIESLSAIGDFVPNLMIYNHGVSGLNTPAMRGLTAFVESMKVSTGLYIDGVPSLNAIGYEDGLLDIERIEILRGPQGTIYGKGAEAGAINITTRQPDNTFQGKVSLQSGLMLSSETDDNPSKSASLRLSGPIITDTLFFGLSGKFYQKDGFIKNTLTDDSADDREHWLGNARLRWTPTTKLDVSLAFDSLSYNDDGNHYGLAPHGATYFSLPLQPDRQVSSNMDEKMESNKQSQSLKIAYDINDSLTITSITTHGVYEYNIAADYDYSPATIYHVDTTNEYKRQSQELRLGYSQDRFKWLAGLYYENEDNEIDYDSISSMYTSTNNRCIDGGTYAAFMNVTYPLTQRLSVNVGLRYETEEQELYIKTLGVRQDNTWDAFTPKMALNYNFNPNIMAFVSVAKGYRSGGFSTTDTDSDYLGYDPETLWSYEIGAKTAFFNNRLMLSGSIYHMDISDMQVEESVTPEAIHITNAAKATSQGIEIEIKLRVTDGFSIDAGFGYNNTEFEEFKDASGDYEGNKNPWAPEYTFHFGGQYRHACGFFARADLIGYGAMFFDKANESSRDPFEIVNVKTGYEGKWFDVYLYAQNLFDSEYNCVGAYGGFYTVYSDPGEIGIQTNIRF